MATEEPAPRTGAKATASSSSELTLLELLELMRLPQLFDPLTKHGFGTSAELGSFAALRGDEGAPPPIPSAAAHQHDSDCDRVRRVARER